MPTERCSANGGDVRAANRFAHRFAYRYFVLLIEACRGWIGRASSKLVEAGSIGLVEARRGWLDREAIHERALAKLDKACTCEAG